ncbi:hypothetical protein BU16DRAFT_532182 [Lophium mytilinum]|uniref:Uncharacterized protein n=1 Tax=Lophium mytilinum TaxID=390894 RepID=A0A6A6Q8J1_9PEZI|nr:hypothetical protein BU16DRAFT_532182 [Lophium mytilinum]
MRRDRSALKHAQAEPAKQVEQVNTVEPSHEPVQNASDSTTKLFKNIISRPDLEKSIADRLPHIHDIGLALEERLEWKHGDKVEIEDRLWVASTIRTGLHFDATLPKPILGDTEKLALGKLVERLFRKAAESGVAELRVKQREVSNTTKKMNELAAELKAKQRETGNTSAEINEFRESEASHDPSMNSLGMWLLLIAGLVWLVRKASENSPDTPEASRSALLKFRGSSAPTLDEPGRANTANRDWLRPFNQD